MVTKFPTHPPSKQPGSSTDTTPEGTPLAFEWDDIGEESKSETPSPALEHQWAFDPLWGDSNPAVVGHAEQHHHSTPRATGVAMPIATPLSAPALPYDGHGTAHISSPSPSLTRRALYSDATGDHPASAGHMDSISSHFLRQGHIVTVREGSSEQAQGAASINPYFDSSDTKGDAAAAAQPQPQPNEVQKPSFWERFLSNLPIIVIVILLSIVLVTQFGFAELQCELGMANACHSTRKIVNGNTNKPPILVETTSSDWANSFPAIVEHQSKVLTSVLQRSVSKRRLWLEMKSIESASTQDLMEVVERGDMARKEPLVRALTGVAREAKAAAGELSKFDARYKGAIESIAAANSAVLRVLAEEQAYRSYAIVHFLGIFFTYSLDRAINAYSKALAEACRVLTPVVEAANVLESKLQSIEEQINTIHEILRKEGLDIVEIRDEVSSSLWTAVGGNKRQLQKLNRELVLIEKLDKFNVEALRHIREAAYKLTTMKDQMDNLRERALWPQWHEGEFGIEIHIKSIESSIRRLWSEVDEGRLIESRFDEAFPA